MSKQVVLGCTARAMRWWLRRNSGATCLWEGGGARFKVFNSVVRGQPAKPGAAWLELVAVTRTVLVQRWAVFIA